jgi:methylthioribulose-1-phosphate dehydratase
VDSAGIGKPSAETLLHVVAARRPGVGAVLHTHSIWATCLSDLYHAQGALPIEGYEMLKGLEGIKTHDHKERIRIFQNTQDIAALSAELQQLLDSQDQTLRFGYLLRRHGLYTWGRDLAEARRHVEILEFLFEVIGHTLTLTG